MTALIAYLLSMQVLALALDSNQVTLLVAVLSTLVAIVTVLVAPMTTIIMFFLNKRVADDARKLEKQEREALAEKTHAELAAVKVLATEAESRMTAHVEEIKSNVQAVKEEGVGREERVTAVVVESGAKADRAFTEANNLNMKLESMGIQTKPGNVSQVMDVHVISDPQNPVHTKSP